MEVTSARQNLAGQYVLVGKFLWKETGNKGCMNDKITWLRLLCSLVPQMDFSYLICHYDTPEVTFRSLWSYSNLVFFLFSCLVHFKPFTTPDPRAFGCDCLVSSQPLSQKMTNVTYTTELNRQKAIVASARTALSATDNNSTTSDNNYRTAHNKIFIQRFTKNENNGRTLHALAILSVHLPNLILL